MRQYLLILFTLLMTNLHADIGNFDVIQLQNGTEILFVKIYSVGILKNSDLNYYDWDGEQHLTVKEHLFDPKSLGDSIDVFSTLVKLDLRKLNPDYEMDRDSILYLLSDQRKMCKSDLMLHFDLTDAFNGNTFGYTLTEGITDQDNSWIGDYELEKLFDINDYELCGMSLYGIKNNLPEKEQEKLRQALDELLKAYNYDGFEEKLNNLLSKNIIMIGFCSC